MSNYVLGLDIGSVEIHAIIANNDNGFTINGIGKAKTYGIKKGVITNIEQASNSIKQAVLEATKTAGRQYDQVIVSISGAYTKSIESRGVISVPEHEIGITEIKRVMEMAERNAVDVPNDYVKLHVLPYNFKVDEQERVEDPLGMSGSRLEVLTHVIIAPESSVRNLRKAVEMAGLKVDNIVLCGYASAISTLNKDERELGVALVDMGGSICDIVIHLGNSIRYNDVLLIGSANITNDISRVIHTPLPYAEDIKRTYAELIDNGEKEVNLPLLGEDETTHNVSLEIITGVICARCEEALSIIKKKIEDSGFENRIGAGIVLTGGMAKLCDVRDLAMAIFNNTSIRIAKPRNTAGLTEIAKDCSNSCGIGLCMYGLGDFTPYEIDSNGELRHKGETPKIQYSNYEENINKKLNENEGEVLISTPKDLKLPTKKNENVFQKIKNFLNQMF